MFGDFIGYRIKRVREEVFALSQTEFAEELNSYIERRHGQKLLKTLSFNQNVVSLLEGQSKIRRDKFSLLLNFLYNERKINPSWIIIEENNNQPMYLTKLVIDKSLIEKQKELKTYAEKINQTINDIAIVIENSAFN